MKFRIKDPDERKAFDILGYATEFTDEEIDKKCWARYGEWLYFAIADKFVVEPISEGSYADERCKPKKAETGVQKD